MSHREREPSPETALSIEKDLLDQQLLIMFKGGKTLTKYCSNIKELLGKMLFKLKKNERRKKARLEAHEEAEKKRRLEAKKREKEKEREERYARLRREKEEKARQERDEELGRASKPEHRSLISIINEPKNGHRGHESIPPIQIKPQKTKHTEKSSQKPAKQVQSTSKPESGTVQKPRHSEQIKAGEFKLKQQESEREKERLRQKQKQNQKEKQNQKALPASLPKEPKKQALTMPIKPEEPLSAYHKFLNKNKNQIMASAKNLTPIKLIQVMQKIWEQMTEYQRKQYIDQEQRERAQYEKDLGAYYAAMRKYEAKRAKEQPKAKPEQAQKQDADDLYDFIDELAKL